MPEQSLSLLDYQHFFFIGVGGVGMSAIAQYLSGIGKNVSGSDRLFSSSANDELKKQLEAEKISCFVQDGSGINERIQVIIVSTAIEGDNPEVVKANSLSIPIVIRAELLAAICASKRTIAIAGTSGKSSTTAMLFHILEQNGLSPSLITGAGLVRLQQTGKIGNAFCGLSDWLLIEADESDGTLVKYKPEIGVLLSVDKDHKELHELAQIFNTFKANCAGHFIVNKSHSLAQTFSRHDDHDYGVGTRYDGYGFSQNGFRISFEVDGMQCTIPTIGQHSMENALACMAVADILGVSIQQCASALESYTGIYRRHQCIGTKNGITLIDDYAHNPAKIAASIKACQPVADKLVAWFQPHGYGPTRFIRHELVDEISRTLRPQDEIWMSEIYYAGGTAVKDISALDLVNDLIEKGVKATFVADRTELFQQKLPSLKDPTILLLMGARDPSLEKFAEKVWEML